MLVGADWPLWVGAVTMPSRCTGGLSDWTGHWRHWWSDGCSRNNDLQRSGGHWSKLGEHKLHVFLWFCLAVVAALPQLAVQVDGKLSHPIKWGTSVPARHLSQWRSPTSVHGVSLSTGWPHSSLSQRRQCRTPQRRMQLWESWKAFSQLPHRRQNSERWTWTQR